MPVVLQKKMGNETKGPAWSTEKEGEKKKLLQAMWELYSTSAYLTMMARRIQIGENIEV